MKRISFSNVPSSTKNTVSVKKRLVELLVYQYPKIFVIMIAISILQEKYYKILKTFFKVVLFIINFKLVVSIVL